MNKAVFASELVLELGERSKRLCMTVIYTGLVPGTNSGSDFDVIRIGRE